MNNSYSFIQYSNQIRLPNGIYNALYNKEPAIVRIEKGIPVWVQFIGFIKHYEGQDEVRSSSIFDPKGILHSSVEILLPAQEFEFQKFVESI